MPVKIPNSATKAITSTSDITVYTVPTNRKFELKTLIILNNESSDVTYDIYDGTSTAGIKKLTVKVPANDVLPLTQLEGFEFATSVVVKASAYSSGGNITIGGYDKQE